MFLATLTGLGVRIAVVDSGVHAEHPHVVDPGHGRVDGIGILPDGSRVDDFVDRIGHGTAVVAAIREKVPDAEIIAIKIFWQTLSADVHALVNGIDEAAARGAAIVNLSLGTSNPEHRAALGKAVARAKDRGSLIVAAAEDRGVSWLPGCLDDVVGVLLDWACPRDAYRIVAHGARTVIATSGYPRSIPGVPPERNLKGISFAVANATGFLARAIEAHPRASLADLIEILESNDALDESARS